MEFNIENLAHLFIILYIIIFSVYIISEIIQEKRNIKKVKGIFLRSAGDPKIETRIKEHVAALPHDWVFIALQGSQNYGLDEYSKGYRSDVDTKAAVLPSFDDIVRNVSPLSTTIVLENNEHIDTKDIRLMFEMFKKENISYIELLYSKYIFVNPKYKKEMEKLLSMRDRIAAADLKKFVKATYGMSIEKQKALCHPYPSIAAKIDKYGFDGKQLSHCKRLNYFLSDIFSDLNVFPLDFEKYYRLNNSEYRRKVLMNYKKQLNAEGTALMPATEARRIVDILVENNKVIVDEIIKEIDDNKDSEKIYDEMNEILVKILKEAL